MHFIIGNNINNTPSSYKGQWDHDKRFYVHLFCGLPDAVQDSASPKQIEAFQLGTEEFKKVALIVDMRFKVWTAVALNATEQFFDSSEVLSDVGIICGCKYSGRKCPHEARNLVLEEHLYTRGLSLIYGGYSNKKELVDQMCHCDVLDVTTDLGASYSLLCQ